MPLLLQPSPCSEPMSCTLQLHYSLVFICSCKNGRQILIIGPNFSSDDDCQSLISSPKDLYILDVTVAPGNLITYRTIGGILDYFVFMGPTPENVIQQYTSVCMSHHHYRSIMVHTKPNTLFLKTYYLFK